MFCANLRNTQSFYLRTHARTHKTQHSHVTPTHIHTHTNTYTNHNIQQTQCKNKRAYATRVTRTAVLRHPKRRPALHDDLDPDTLEEMRIIAAIAKREKKRQKLLKKQRRFVC